MHIHFAMFDGEVGWEVAQWIPTIRRIAQNARGKHRRITAECRTGFSWLYEDFCDNITERDPVGVPDMMRATVGGKKRSARFAGSADKVICPEHFNIRTLGNGVPDLASEKAYHRYEIDSSEDPGLVVIHARNLSRHPVRNYNRWEKVIELLPGYGVRKLAFVGSKEDYYPSPYNRERKIRYIDARGKPIQDQVAWMKSADIVVGASSGVMHIAQIVAQRPIVVWSGIESSAPRYRESWNPFKTKMRFVPGKWDPKPEDVAKAVASGVATRALP
jgi:hypothetical protein